MKQNIELRKLRDFGQVINDTFTFLKENFKPLLRTLFIICGFFLLMSTVTTAATYLNMANIFAPVSAANLYSSRSFTSSYILSSFLNSGVLILAHLCIQLVTLCYISVYLQNNNTTPTFAEVWGFFKYYFFRILGSGFLLLILFMVGLVFCFIPGFYLIPIFALVFPIMVIENASFSYAFNKSFRLIKENWWFVFGIIFITGLIVGVAASVASIPLSILTMFNKFLTTKNFSTPLIIFFSALQSLIMLAYCIPAIAIALCYFDLSEQKDGVGLLDRIENFGKVNDDPSALPGEQY